MWGSGAAVIKWRAKFSSVSFSVSTGPKEWWERRFLAQAGNFWAGEYAQLKIRLLIMRGMTA